MREREGTWREVTEGCLIKAKDGSVWEVYTAKWLDGNGDGRQFTIKLGDRETIIKVSADAKVIMVSREDEQNVPGMWGFAPVDGWTPWEIRSHLFILHGTFTDDVKSKGAQLKADLLECHTTLHYRPSFNGIPHTHREKE